MQNGISLLEVMIALSLALVLLSSTKIVLRELKPSPLLSETERFQAYLEDLIARVPTESKPIELRCQSLSCQASLGERLLNFQLQARVRFADSSRSRILLFPSGTTTPATITLQEGKRRCRLALSLRGRLRKRCADTIY